MKMTIGPFFSFFFFFFCFVFVFHFSKPLKFVLGLPKWEFSTGKKYFMLGKKSGKITLPPLKNIPLMPLLICRSVNKNGGRYFIGVQSDVYRLVAHRRRWGSTLHTYK